jgi:pantothenate kinase-related protein Tda10
MPTETMTKTTIKTEATTETEAMTETEATTETVILMTTSTSVRKASTTRCVFYGVSGRQGSGKVSVRLAKRRPYGHLALGLEFSI